MEEIRKPIGLLIIVFVGMPALFVVTWIMGITWAASKPNFLPELPTKISNELPETVDLLFEAAKLPHVIDSEEARTWILAAAEAETKPSQVLEEAGFLEWLRIDLSKSLSDFYSVLSGETYKEYITLDLRPLRNAIHHEAIDQYFLEVVNHLPPCKPHQQAVWRSIGDGKKIRRGLPACKPDQTAINRVANKLKRRRADMPNQVILIRGDDIGFLGIDLLSLALGGCFLLFLIPTFFIAFGGFIAEPMNYRAFKWSGVATIITGLTVLVTAFLPKLILKITLILIPWVGTKQEEFRHWPDGLIQEITERLRTLVLVVVDPLFSPVISLSLIISFVGAFLVGIYFFLGRETSIRERPPLPRR